jgi:hypothetical protein
MEDRRQSQAIHNAKVKLGPLALLRGFSRGVDIEPIAEDIESKTVEKEDLFVPPLGQKSQNSFAVGGKVVRLSKSATTGRIGIPQQDFQMPIFERPKIPSSENLNASPATPKNAEKSPFSVLADLTTPRQSNVPILDPINPYQTINEGYDAQSETDDLSPKVTNSTRCTFLQQTRGRSKSDETSPSNQPPIENILHARNTTFLREVSPLQAPSIPVQVDVKNVTKNPAECTIVSGFDDNQPGSGSGSCSPVQPLPPIQGNKWNVADIEESEESS